jgi:uncharacterized membrane protein YczE
MSKINSWRWLFYSTGLVILAFGLILNSRSGLGISPILSVSYTISQITGICFADITCLWYLCIVVFEIIVHRNRKEMVLNDVLQIPVSILFTRIMHVFSLWIPQSSGNVWMLLFAILCTGIGAAMSLDMRIVANPGDGIVQTLSDATGKSIGFVKNGFDIFCCVCSVIMGILWTGHVKGIGLGTILCMIGVGRCVACFNTLCLKPMSRKAQLEYERQ